MLYQHGNNPSRLNPRMPVPKRGQGDHHDFSSMYDDSNKSNLSLLDETISGSSAITNAMLSPLYGDSIMRTPMDLIQVRSSSMAKISILIVVDFLGGFPLDTFICLSKSLL